MIHRQSWHQPWFSEKVGVAERLSPAGLVMFKAHRAKGGLLSFLVGNREPDAPILGDFGNVKVWQSNKIECMIVD